MFEVFWAAHALNQLADVWTRAADRAAVTDASYVIDSALARDPEHEGESREDPERVVFHAPLGVRYHIDSAAKLVTVIACWRIGRP
jgi:hypothetical protein